MTASADGDEALLDEGSFAQVVAAELELRTEKLEATA